MCAFAETSSRGECSHHIGGHPRMTVHSDRVFVGKGLCLGKPSLPAPLVDGVHHLQACCATCEACAIKSQSVAHGGSAMSVLRYMLSPVSTVNMQP